MKRFTNFVLLAKPCGSECFTANILYQQHFVIIEWKLQILTNNFKWTECSGLSCNVIALEVLIVIHNNTTTWEFKMIFFLWDIPWNEFSLKQLRLVYSTSQVECLLGNKNFFIKNKFWWICFLLNNRSKFR